MKTLAQIVEDALLVLAPAQPRQVSNFDSRDLRGRDREHGAGKSALAGKMSVLAGRG